MTDVANFLDAQIDDIPETRSLTEGQYRFAVKSYREDQVGENQTTKVTYFVKPIGVIESEEFDDETVNDAENVRLEYFATPNSLKQKAPVISLKRFLIDVVELPDEGMSLREVMELSLGAEFEAVVEIRMEGKNKDLPIPRIKRFIL